MFNRQFNDYVTACFFVVYLPIAFIVCCLQGPFIVAALARTFDFRTQRAMPC